MSGGEDDRGMMAEINVTPFVDVMLVLLIIFMVTAPMMTTGVEVELPRVDAPSMPQKEESQLVLGIKGDGTFWIQKLQVPEDELLPKLKAIITANPQQDVFVQADASVPYEKVAKLMALCTEAGIPRVGLVTQPGVD
jgi:biopolymer transport protein TolR